MSKPWKREDCCDKKEETCRSIEMSHLLGASESSINNSNHRLSYSFSSSSIMSSLSIIKVLRLYTHLFLYFGVLFNTYASGALLPSRLAVIGDPIGPNQQQPNEDEYSSNVISSPLSLSLNQIGKNAFLFSSLIFCFLKSLTFVIY